MANRIGGCENCDAKECITGQIRRAPVWRILSRDDIRWFNKYVVCQSRDPGEAVFYEGSTCRGVYLICEGLVASRKTSTDGKSVLMRLSHPGDMLGYRPFLANEPHRATAEFLKPGRTCFLNSTTMRDFLLRKPLVGLALLQQVSRELGQAEERFSVSVTKALRVRLAHWLLLMKEPYGKKMTDGKILLELPISRSDMAEMLGVRSESLSRTIHQMTADGVLEFSGHKAWLNEPDRLIAEADIEN